MNPSFRPGTTPFLNCYRSRPRTISGGAMSSRKKRKYETPDRRSEWRSDYVAPFPPENRLLGHGGISEESRRIDRGRNASIGKTSKAPTTRPNINRPGLTAMTVGFRLRRFLAPAPRIAGSASCWVLEQHDGRSPVAENHSVAPSDAARRSGGQPSADATHGKGAHRRGAKKAWRMIL